MHVEIQVALNFLLSFLYNKLPRRRVNQFGEELERALRLKFVGHWYPEKPFKGSAFRCLKTALPLDPVFEVAAHESGTALADIQENLPEELSIWIDPGEVSYRLGEKGIAKLLYSECETSTEDREICRTFNPEAQCFKPIDPAALASLSLSPSPSSSPFSPSPPKTSPSPCNGAAAFMPKAKVTTPLTFTTATFAQTKFGSTKLKSNGKRSHRMSPTEFSSYIKTRAIIQQQQQQTPQLFQQRPRSLSPTTPPSGDPGIYPQQYDFFSAENNSRRGLSLFLDKSPFASPVNSGAAAGSGKNYDGYSSVGGVSYPNQHLLMAN